MKLVIGMVLVAVLLILPIVLVGIKNRDSVLVENTYLKNMRYNDIKTAEKSTEFTFNEPECISGRCELSFGIVPEPDNNSVKPQIVRPVGNGTVPAATEYENGLWVVNFVPKDKGWYIFKVDFALKGLNMDFERSFYYE